MEMRQLFERIEMSCFNKYFSFSGVILGAFFYGYLTTQLPGGVLGNKYGGKMVFGYGVLVTSLLSLATPIVARTSYVLFIALRVIEGIGEVRASISYLKSFVNPFICRRFYQ